MARKPTIAEQRQSMIDAYFGTPDDNDPLVNQVRARLQREEEEKRRRVEEQRLAASRPDFTDVISRVESSQPASERGLLSQAFANLTSPEVVDTVANSALGQSILGSLDQLNAASTTLARDTSNPFLGGAARTSTFLGGLAEGRLGAGQSDESLIAAGKAAGASARIRQKASRDVIESMEPGILRELNEAGADFAASPESVGSVFGGAGGLLSMGGQYLRTYDQARREGGMSKEDAEAYAAMKSAPEAIGFIPAGQLLSKIPGFNKIAGKAADAAVGNIVANTARRIGGTALGEGVGETITTQAQMATDALLAQHSKSEKVREFALNQLPKDITDFWDQSWRSFKAGVLGGSVFDAPSSVIESAHEAGRRAGDISNLVDSAKLRNAQTREVDNRIQPTMVDTDEIANRKYLRDRDYDRALEQVRERDARAADELALAEGTRDLQVAGRAEAGGAMADAFRRAGLEGFRTGKAEAPTPAVVEPTDTGAQQAPSFDQRYTDEAAKAVTDDAKKVKTAAGTARSKARNVFKTAQIAETRALTPEQRQTELATRMRAWDQANPLEKFQQQAAAPPKPKAKKKAAPTKNNTADLAALMQQQASARTSPLGQASNEDTGTTVDDVGEALQKSVTSASTGQIATLGRNKQLELVQDQNDIPIEGLQQAGKGFYDPKTGKVYIVANKLDKANIKGDMLDVLSHEVKHGADIGGSQGVRASFKSLVGDKANENINTQIRNLAKQDSRDGKNARKVIEFVEKNYPKEDWALELPANFINAANATQGGPVRTIVSAVRTAFKNATGNDNINLNDVKYLAGRLVRDVAARSEEGERFTKTGDSAKPLIVSEGTGASQALMEGRTYLSADGKRKYEIDDSGSRLKIPADVRLKKRYVASDIFDHPELYKELPNLKKVPVMFENDETSKYGASYRKGDAEEPMGMIIINLSNQKTGDRNAFNSLTHRDFLHEMQHAAQDESRTTGGASPEDFLSANGKRLHRLREDAIAALNFVRTMGGDAAMRADIEDQLVQITADYDDEFNAAITKYHKVLGEGEAYNTVERLPLTARERAEDTTDIGRNVEQQIVEKEGYVTSEKGKRFTSEARSQPLAALSGLDLEQATDAASTGWRIAKRLFTPTSGFGHELNEMRLNSRNFVASESAKAENLGRNYQEAVKNVAKDQGIPEDLLREEIEKTLDEVDSIPDPTRRAARMDALDRRFPGVGRALNDLRNYKLQLSRELIAIRLRDGSEMSDKEAAIYKKIIENAETYSTRAYRSQLGGDAGQVYAKDFLKKAKKNPNSPEGKKLAAGMEWLINNQLMIPNRQALQQMTTSQLRRLHEQWVGPTGNFKGPAGKAQMIERLDDMERMTRDELQPVAMDTIKQLLGLTETQGPVASYYRGAKQDRTILNARKDVPVELREVMGEIRDPYLREMLSVARMTQLMGKTRLLTEVYESGKGRWWSNAPRPGFDEKLTGEAFGPLRNKYVTKDAYDFLSDVSTYNSTFDANLANSMRDPTFLTKAASGYAIPVLSKIAGAGKMASIVLSPFAMAMNAVGAATIVLPQNGMIPGTKETWSALSNAAKVIKGTVKKHDNPKSLQQARELLFAGVMDSATVGEFRSKLYGDIFEEIGRLDANSSGYYMKAFKLAQAKIAKGGKTGVGLVRDVYAFMDVWAKVATYYNRKDFLTAYNTANNGNMSEEDIMRQAGYQASLTNISYDLAIPGVRLLERNAPFIAQFATYFSEVPRSLAFSAAVGIQDINLARNASTTEARNLAASQAFKRLTGTALVVSGLSAGLAYVLSQEDDKERRKSQLDPEWERANYHINLGTDENGNEVMANINRVDPNGPLNDAVRQVILAPKDRKLDAMQDAFTGLFVRSESVARTWQIINDALLPDSWDTRRKTNTVMERQFPNAYNWMAQTFNEGDIGENVMSALDTFIPAPVLGAIDKNRVPLKDAGVGTALARLSGFKAVVRDADRSLGFRAMDYNNAIKELNKDKSELLQRMDSLDSEELTEEIQDLIKAEQKQYDDLYRAYDGYLAFDKKTPRTALAILKDRKVGPEVMQSVKRGQFETRLFSPRSINKWAKEQIKKNPDERDDINRKRDLIIAAYTSGQEE